MKQTRSPRKPNMEVHRSLWEQRLKLYLSLGPERTVEKAWRTWCGIPGIVPDSAMPKAWHKFPRQHRWNEWAATYDRDTQHADTHAPVAQVPDPHHPEELPLRPRHKRAVAPDMSEVAPFSGDAQEHTSGTGWTQDLDRQSLIAAHPYNRMPGKAHTLRLLLGEVLAALSAARLDLLSTDEARTLLPANRMLLATVNNILRAEATAGTAATDEEEGEGGHSPLMWEAAMRKVRRHWEKMGAKEDMPETNVEEVAQEAAQVQTDETDASAVTVVESGADVQPEREERKPGKGRALLVVIGGDPALMVDLAMLRGVRKKTGITLHRLVDATSQQIVDHLRRERELGRPVRWMHIACHGSSDGLLLADGLVDGDWLSAHLQGIDVLLLAACKGEMVGDWLAVVPHVVSFSATIGHGEAAVMAKHFWLNMGKGATPDEALECALEASPEVVGEFVVKHW